MARRPAIAAAGVLVIAALAAAGAALIAGCGKKGPPVPPPRYRPAAVEDLSFELTDGHVALAWTIPAGSDPQQVRAAACSVLRARRALADTDCPECRPAFTKRADVAVPAAAAGKPGREKLGFSEAVSPGFEYFYRVVCRSAAGAFGDESNLVRFEYPQPTTQQP